MAVFVFDYKMLIFPTRRDDLILICYSITKIHILQFTLYMLLEFSFQIKNSRVEIQKFNAIIILNIFEHNNVAMYI